MPADQPAPEADANTARRSRTVAAGSRTPRATAAVAESSGAATPAKKAAGKKAPAKGRAKPAIAPSTAAGEGAVLAAVAVDGTAVAVVDAGSEGLTLDETVLTGKDGVEVAAADDEAAEPGTDFEWDEEEESEALRQARKDAELTASADSVRAYLKQIGKVALLNAEEEVDLAKRIEAGLYGSERLRQVEEEGIK
ncbi:RNA polymerase sigma factor, partial [Blastococcus sp. TF02-09]|uniref:sigma-70 factor domain-containing protein n=1 Tax=Blastococcus sp. TF02-09 TaxID=2250576 RepID=UPI000E1A171E